MVMLVSSLCRHSCTNRQPHSHMNPQLGIAQDSPRPSHLSTTSLTAFHVSHSIIINELLNVYWDSSQNTHVHNSAFVRCRTEEQEGHHSYVVNSRPQERDLNLELMHAGGVHSNATRKSLVIPKILYSYTHRHAACQTEWFSIQCHQVP